ncbi:MAG TPA: aldehyde dehydrogenase family protein, partial [Pyrinomonadaceae bacterium]|nr:aldehyde dehydrogenase family protein [Pyrinomonadaceae bacterium]
MRTQTLPADLQRQVVSIDPSSGEEIGRAALMTPSDVAAAVHFARTAQPAWAALSYRERARFILRARELVL